MIKKRKKGLTLVELVVTIAVTAIVLAEVSTFLVYLRNHTILAHNIERSYSVVTTVKELITYDYESDPEFDTSETYLKETYVQANEYDDIIKSVSIVGIYPDDDSKLYLCNIEYSVKENSNTNTYSFVLIKDHSTDGGT